MIYCFCCTNLPQNNETNFYNCADFLLFQLKHKAFLRGLNCVNLTHFALVVKLFVTRVHLRDPFLYFFAGLFVRYRNLCLLFRFLIFSANQLNYIF